MRRLTNSSSARCTSARFDRARVSASVSLVLLNSFGGKVVSTARVGGAAGAAEAAEEAQRPQKAQAAGQVELSVRGMHCEGCARAVSEALRETGAVESVDADPKTRRVRVRLRRKVHAEALAARAWAASFEVK